MHVQCTLACIDDKVVLFVIVILDKGIVKPKGGKYSYMYGVHSKHVVVSSYLQVPSKSKIIVIANIRGASAY